MDRLFSGPMSIGDGGDTDVEALQTDVMRFLSIIALCLLAVFAAVSSEPPAAVKAMAEVQQAMIESLQAKLESVEQKYEVAETESNRQIEALQQKLQEPPKIDAELLGKLNQKSELQTQHIESLMGHLDKSEAQKTKLQQQIEILQQQLDELTPEPVQFPVEEITQPAPEVEDTTPVAEPVETEQGFTLGFASDQALLALVRGGRVQLFADVLGQVWHLSKGMRNFTEVSAVEQFYQLNSVPQKLLNLARRKISSSAEISWGVSFDASIRADLQQLMSEYQSGNIVVQQSGQLIRE